LRKYYFTKILETPPGKRGDGFLIRSSSSVKEERPIYPVIDFGRNKLIGRDVIPHFWRKRRR
jgi:hypothetical protein